MTVENFSVFAAKDVVECVGEDRCCVEFAVVAAFLLASFNRFVYSPGQPQKTLLEPFLNDFCDFFPDFPESAVFVDAYQRMVDKVVLDPFELVESVAGVVQLC